MLICKFSCFALNSTESSSSESLTTPAAGNICLGSLGTSLVRGDATTFAKIIIHTDIHTHTSIHTYTHTLAFFVLISE